MKNSKSWKTRARNLVVGGLCGLAALVSGCGSNNVLIDKNLITKPYVETAFVSDLVTKHGFMLKGQNRQDFINVDLNNRLSAFIWQTYSHKDNAFHERDFGFSYNLPINDKISVRTGYEYWDYPSGTFGDYDSVLKAGAHYSGKIDLDFDLTQLLPNKQTESGTRYYLKASKKLFLGKIYDVDISLTPSISTALIDNYYKRTGHSQVTPGLNLGIGKGKGNLNFFVNCQDGKMPGIKDKVWSGVSLGYKF